MGASITIPDQNMSMRTLMDRYRRGMPLDVKVKQPQYHNGEFPDITRMDLSEVENLKKFAAQEVSELRHQLEKEEVERQKQQWMKKEQEIEALKKQLEESKLKQRPEGV